MRSDLQEPPPLPPRTPVPARPMTSGQGAAEGPFSSVALALFGGFVGCVAGAAYSVLAVYAAARAARDIAEPGAAAFVALGVYGLAVVLFFAVAGAAAFGVRVTSQLSGLPIVAIVLVRAWIQHAPTASAAAGGQVVALSWDTTLIAALVWAVSGGVLAWRLSRTPSLTQAQERNPST